MLYHPLRAHFASHGCEVKILRPKILAFLVGWNFIQYTQDLTGIFVWYVWDIFEGVGERRYNEAVITAQSLADGVNKKIIGQVCMEMVR